MENDKLDLASPDLVNENFQKLAALFPNCVTESSDGKAIDFDLLKQELNHAVVEGNKERYRLEWPGKREAIVTANLPTTKTLRPVREDSVDFDTTENIYIEGDNLEVLKLLQESYLGKIKMIYIDPPYNTGKDFVYKDNFTKDLKEELLESGQKDEFNQRLIVNPETSGRYHSDWLTMMYPRLKLARNLLTEDGVIFISIDDNEVHNLRKLCDEVFGDKSFVAELIWKRRSSSALADNNVSTDHEYVLTYQKGNLGEFIGIQKDFRNYSNPDNDPRGEWVLGDLTVGMTASMRPNQAYDLIDPITGNKFHFNPNRVWAYIPESMKNLLYEKRVVFPKDPAKRPMIKRFRNELKSTFNPISSILIDHVGLNTEATRNIQELMGGNLFDYSKPISLLNTLIKQICSSNDIVLDFFSGSSVTANSVLNLNSEDGLKRSYIMVQIPELNEEKSEAYKAGYRNICELGKERIRRASKKIIEEQNSTLKNKIIEYERSLSAQLTIDDNPKGMAIKAEIDFLQNSIDNFDSGFRVYRLASSNMNDVYYKPQDYKQDQLDIFTDNFKPDRTADDLLAQVMLDWGLPLSLKIEHTVIYGKHLFKVAGNSLFACFDKGIDEEFAREIAKETPLRIVFRDNGFKDDTAKTNVKQLLKQLSPDTEMKVI